MGRGLALILIVLCCLGMSGDGPPRISFVHPPYNLAEGYTQRFDLRIPPDADNRRVDLSGFDTESGERVSYTERDLDGRSAALQNFYLLLPSGDLMLVAKLLGTSGYVAQAQTPVRVEAKLGP